MLTDQNTVHTIIFYKNTNYIDVEFWWTVLNTVRVKVVFNL